jgi:hypothetical protein
MYQPNTSHRALAVMLHGEHSPEVEQIDRRAEEDVRAFAAAFPTPQVIRAVALCTEGRLAWTDVHDLFRTSTAKALAAVSA